MTAPTIRHPESLLRDAGEQAKDLAQIALGQGQDLAQTALDRGQALTADLSDRTQDVQHRVTRRTRAFSGWVNARRRPLTYLAVGLTLTIVVVGVARIAMSSSGAEDNDDSEPLASQDGPLSQRARDAESAYPSNDQPAVEPTEAAQRMQRGVDKEPGEEPPPVKTGDVIPSGHKE